MKLLSKSFSNASEHPVINTVLGMIILKAKKDYLCRLRQVLSPKASRIRKKINRPELINDAMSTTKMTEASNFEFLNFVVLYRVDFCWLD
jgi:hypothetical protein